MSSVIDFDLLDDKDGPVQAQGESLGGWIPYARPILESECLVYTCCLKTHRPLGSLHHGPEAGRRCRSHPPDMVFNYMREMHGSAEWKKDDHRDQSTLSNPR